jgi:hypothetical protein
MIIFYSNKDRLFHTYNEKYKGSIPAEQTKFVTGDVSHDNWELFARFIRRKYDGNLPEIEQLRKDYYTFFKDADINHPSHYTDGKIEVIDFIEDKNLNFHRANAVKYISRAGKKEPSKEIEDLKKAVWYLNREIERLEK